MIIKTYFFYASLFSNLLQYIAIVKQTDTLSKRKNKEDKPVTSEMLLRVQLGEDSGLQMSKKTQALLEPGDAFRALDPALYKTVTSDKGILQNPTGWHEGERVWGGGIVKVKSWAPWPIDTDPDADLVFTPPAPGESYNSADPAKRIITAAARSASTNHCFKHEQF